jgi:uncharacterized protein (TIGR02452 family)
MKRSERAALAQQTVEIVQAGFYLLAEGHRVDIQPHIQSCLEATRYVTPEDLRRRRRESLALPLNSASASIEVRNETTLAGAARLLSENPRASLAALNFASAKNPGGGFLNGSEAQEESLARSSALYASLRRAPEYYEGHRWSNSSLYSDAMILSPGCPVFRDDDGRLLKFPFHVTFITSAAPNAGAIARNQPELISEIPSALAQRAEFVLALAASAGCDSLVLGAWGCGVFNNDADMVAETFANLLTPDGVWTRRFARIVFSILDKNSAQETFTAFQRAFE